MAWLIVGLGNPGEEYRKSRHNAGREAAERFALVEGFTPMKEDKKNKARVWRGAIGKTLVVVLAPDTFMNRSGSAVARYVKSKKAAERMVVVHDDLDLPLGAMKISFDRGSGGHKGLESVIRAVKTKKFARVRLGISLESASGKLKKPAGEDDVLDFILGAFAPHERALLSRVEKRAQAALETIVREGVARAMNEFN